MKKAADIPSGIPNSMPISLVHRKTAVPKRLLFLSPTDKATLSIPDILI